MVHRTISCKAALFLYFLLYRSLHFVSTVIYCPATVPPRAGVRSFQEGYQHCGIAGHVWKGVVSPHLECCAQFWSLLYKKAVDGLERGHKGDPRMGQLPCEERLREWGLFGLRKEG